MTSSPSPPRPRLDFASERDDATTSWERADPTDALIERVNRYGWKVCLRDGETPHVVALAREDGEYVGRCDCKGFEYGDDGSPCAHLCALRKADFADVDDVEGLTVNVEPAQRDRDDARADGGRVVERPRDLETEPAWTGR